MSVGLYSLRFKIWWSSSIDKNKLLDKNNLLLAKNNSTNLKYKKELYICKEHFEFSGKQAFARNFMVEFKIYNDT